MELPFFSRLVLALTFWYLGARSVLVAAESDDSMPMACQIVRSQTNPYWDDMIMASNRRADELGIELHIFETSPDGTVEGLEASQINVDIINQCMEDGAKGILLSIRRDLPDSTLIEDAIVAAREAGVLVIALDGCLAGADACFATNNHAAGFSVGEYAAASESDPENASIAIVSCNEDEKIIFERLVGFIDGFGLNVTYDVNSTVPSIGIDFSSDTADDRVTVVRPVDCSLLESATSEMKDVVATYHSDEDPLTMVYAVNEIGGLGALISLEEAGLNGTVRVMTIDGSCDPGITQISKGGFHGNAIQFPEKMAALGIEAIDAFVKEGIIPIDIDTGTDLAAATDPQVEGIVTLDATEAAEVCWGPFADDDPDEEPPDDDDQSGGAALCPIAGLTPLTLLVTVALPLVLMD